MKKGKESFLFYTIGEKRILLGKSIGIVLILDYFFYQSLWAVIPLSGIGFIYYRMEKNFVMIKKGNR